jgi:hypothetical protein
MQSRSGGIQDSHRDHVPTNFGRSSATTGEKLSRDLSRGPTNGHFRPRISLGAGPHFSDAVSLLHFVAPLSRATTLRTDSIFPIPELLSTLGLHLKMVSTADRHVSIPSRPAASSAPPAASNRLMKVDCHFLNFCRSRTTSALQCNPRVPASRSLRLVGFKLPCDRRKRPSSRRPADTPC